MSASGGSVNLRSDGAPERILELTCDRGDRTARGTSTAFHIDTTGDDKAKPLVARKHQPDSKREIYLKLIPKVLARYTESRNSNSSAPVDDTTASAQPATASSSGEEEKRGTKRKAIDEINDKDVLFGRASVQRSHPGNAHLKQLCDRYRDRYEAGQRRRDKTSVTWDIVKEIKSGGGRFMRPSEGKSGWTEVGDEEAREKVANTMRDSKHAALED